MKVLSFETEGRRSYGMLRNAGVYEAATAFRERYADLRAVLAAGVLDELAANLADDVVPQDQFRFLPTIPNPDKMICVGVNYRPHVEEMGRDVPGRPLLFVRFSGSQVGHGQALVKTSVSEQYDFEGELAVVIGRRGQHITQHAAADFIAGYTCFMDGTVRDWQRHTSQFTPGKNFDRSGAMGPYLVTPDELEDVRDLLLTTRVNGEIMQQARISDLIFDILALIEYCSTFAELLPGDVIATGTPGGVGAARKPPVWLKAGDRVEVDIAALGCLANTVVDD